LRFHKNSAKKMRPTTAMIAETMALEMTPLSVNTSKSSDTSFRTWFVWVLPNFSTLTTTLAIARAYLSNWTVGEANVNGVNEEEGIKEGDRVDEVAVGRGVGSENIVLLIRGVQFDPVDTGGGRVEDVPVLDERGEKRTGPLGEPLVSTLIESTLNT